MFAYIAKRLLLLPLLLFVFSIIAFLLIQAPPGDFVTSYVAELAASGSSMDQIQIDALRKLYGLDQPIYVQLWSYLSRVLVFDLGYSYFYNAPVVSLILEKLPATLLLVFSAQILAIVVGTILGVLAAKHRFVDCQCLEI